MKRVMRFNLSLGIMKSFSLTEILVGAREEGKGQLEKCFPKSQVRTIPTIIAIFCLETLIKMREDKMSRFILERFPL